MSFHGYLQQLSKIDIQIHVSPCKGNSIPSEARHLDISQIELNRKVTGEQHLSCFAERFGQKPDMMASFLSWLALHFIGSQRYFFPDCSKILKAKLVCRRQVLDLAQIESQMASYQSKQDWEGRQCFH